jgi:hypothetical protein
MRRFNDERLIVRQRSCRDCRTGNLLPLNEPLAAGHEQPRSASSQNAEHQQQAPDRQEKQRQDAGVFRVGLTTPTGANKPMAPPISVVVVTMNLGGIIMRRATRAAADNA